jgi:hypothetical protein
VNDDGRTVAAMDVLAPGIGEIIGGSQREERLEVLDRSMAERGIDREPARRHPLPANARKRAVLMRTASARAFHSRRISARSNWLFLNRPRCEIRFLKPMASDFADLCGG